MSWQGNLPPVIVLCGGEGVRLRPLTYDCPKPLIQLRGRSIIDYVLEHLRSYGFTDITLAAGYKFDMLRDHFLGSDIRVVDTGNQDIAGRLRQLDTRNATETLVLYGDTLSDVNLTSLITSHREGQHQATVTVWPLRSSFGLFQLSDNGQVQEYREKPILDHWINIGYFVFSRDALRSIGDSDSFEVALRQLVNARSLQAFQHHGLHITVNTRAELEDAETSLATWHP